MKSRTPCQYLENGIWHMGRYWCGVFGDDGKGNRGSFVLHPTEFNATNRSLIRLYSDGRFWYYGNRWEEYQERENTVVEKIENKKKELLGSGNFFDKGITVGPHSVFNVLERMCDSDFPFVANFSWAAGGAGCGENHIVFRSGKSSYGGYEYQLVSEQGHRMSIYARECQFMPVSFTMKIGGISNIRVFDKELTKEEITLLFNKPKPMCNVSEIKNGWSSEFKKTIVGENYKYEVSVSKDTISFGEENYTPSEFKEEISAMLSTKSKYEKEFGKIK